MKKKVNLSLLILIDVIFSFASLESLLLYLVLHGIGISGKMLLLSFLPFVFKLLDWLNSGLTYRIEIIPPILYIDKKQINFSQIDNKINIYKVILRPYAYSKALYLDYLYRFEFKKQEGDIITFSVGFFSYCILKKIFQELGLFPNNVFKPHSKIFVGIILLFSVIGIGFLTYIQKPSPKLDTQTAEYVKILDDGIKSFQNNNCTDALLKYKKAETLISNDSELYLNEAYCYKEQKDYNKALDAINKAEDLYNNKVKSTYAKAKNYRFFDNKSAIYQEKGRINYQLNNYSDAVYDFTQEINSTTYKYTKAYLWRGCAKFYNNDKNGALADFIKHKEIINMYLKDQATSEYKAKYPEYTVNDLTEIEQWIQKVN